MFCNVTRIKLVKTCEGFSLLNSYRTPPESCWETPPAMPSGSVPAGLPNIEDLTNFLDPPLHVFTSNYS